MTKIGTAYLTKKEFDSLPEYSLTTPTGPKPGLRFKSQKPARPDGEWYLAIVTQPFTKNGEELVGFDWSIITIVEPEKPKHPFIINRIFYSKYLRNLKYTDRIEYIPIKVVSVIDSENQLIVDWGSGSGHDTWNLQHCIWAIERGEYSFMPSF